MNYDIMIPPDYGALWEKDISYEGQINELKDWVTQRRNCTPQSSL